MAKTVCCRLCLAMDVRMYVLTDRRLQLVYEKLTNVMFNKLRRPLVACYMCYFELRKCHKLMLRSMKAEMLLTLILQHGHDIRKDSIAKIDREKHHLNNNILSMTPIINPFLDINTEDNPIESEIQRNPCGERDETETDITQIVELDETESDNENTDTTLQTNLTEKEDTETATLDDVVHVDLQHSVGGEDEAYEEFLQLLVPKLEDNQYQVRTKNFKETPAESTSAASTSGNKNLGSKRRRIATTDEVPSGSDDMNIRDTTNNQEILKDIPGNSEVAASKKNPSVTRDNNSSSTNIYIDNSGRKHSETIFTCDDCGDMFWDERFLLEHKEQHHKVIKVNRQDIGEGNTLGYLEVYQQLLTDTAMQYRKMQIIEQHNIRKGKDKRAGAESTQEYTNLQHPADSETDAVMRSAETQTGIKKFECAVPIKKYKEILTETKNALISDIEKIVDSKRRRIIADVEVPTGSKNMKMLSNIKATTSNEQISKDITGYSDVVRSKNIASVASINKCSSTNSNVGNSSGEHLTNIFTCDDCGDMFWDERVLREHREEHNDVIMESNQKRGEEYTQEYEESHQETPVNTDTAKKYTETPIGKKKIECAVSAKHKATRTETRDVALTNNILKLKRSRQSATADEIPRGSYDMKMLSNIKNTANNKQVLKDLPMYSDVATSKNNASVTNIKSTANNKQISKDIFTGSDVARSKNNASVASVNNYSSTNSNVGDSSGKHLTNIFTCDDCGDMFWDERVLREHREKHNDVIMESNQKRGEEYTQEYEKSHQETPVNTDTAKKYTETPTGKKTFECNICNREFKRKSYFTAHLEEHTWEKRHQCEFCNRKFYFKKEFLQHMSVHTRARFECYVCHRRFVRNYDLKRHFRIHAGKKLFGCYICQRNFSDNGNLIAHLRIHTENKTL